MTPNGGVSPTVGVGVSCSIWYSIVSYLYVSCSGLITSVGEGGGGGGGGEWGRESSFVCYRLLVTVCNCKGECPHAAY